MSSTPTCHACSEDIAESDIMQCTGSCESNFHFSCAGLTKAQFSRRNKKSKWLCVECTSPETPFNNAAILKLIQDQNAELKSFINNKFEDLTASIEFNSSIIKELKESITNLENSNKSLQTKCTLLESENTEMKKQLTVLQSDVIDLKQYTRRCNIEISNFPESENENLIETMKKVEELTETNFVESISVIHRVPSFNRDKPKPIICQLNSKPIRDILLKKLRTAKLTTNQINSRLTPMPVYFNEHLAPENKQLFFHARKFKDENQYKFCWSRDGKIFLRKDESSKFIRIKTVDDLNGLRHSE